MMTKDTTNDLLLAHLAGELPREILLDHLKEANLVPMEEELPQEPPLALNIRWALRRDLGEMIACDEGPDAWGTAEFIHNLRRRTCISMVAECGEKVVGFVVYDLLRDRLEVLRVAVHPESRRLTVGSQLIATLVKKVQAHHRRNCLEASVEMNDLRACLFLAARGFQLDEHGERLARLVLPVEREEER